MSKALSYMRRRKEEGTFELQITSMIDIFTIMVFFLLKSFASSAVINAAPTTEIRLPSSASQTEPIESLRLMVSKSAIFVDDKKILELKDGSIPAEFLDKNDAQFVRVLFEELDKQATKSRDIANVNEAVKFDGKVVMQADESLSYDVLKKVMYTATLAGYNDLKLAAVKQE